MGLYVACGLADYEEVSPRLTPWPAEAPERIESRVNRAFDGQVLYLAKGPVSKTRTVRFAGPDLGL
jgi:hypothetical protein